jgi:hypothetical protein
MAINNRPPSKYDHDRQEFYTLGTQPVRKAHLRQKRGRPHERGGVSRYRQCPRYFLGVRLAVMMMSWFPRLTLYRCRVWRGDQRRVFADAALYSNREEQNAQCIV